MRAAIDLLVVCWLPGAALFRMPFLQRDGRAALPAEERLYWQVILSIATSLSLVVGMAAWHRYSFTRLLIADVAVAVAAAGVSRGSVRLGPAARRPGLAAFVPIGLVVLGAWRFFPPSEYIIGGKDPGVYVNEGVQLAQRGAIVVHDPVVADVPPFARDLFFPRDRNRTRFLAPRFMGFFIVDPDRGAVVGQFPHLFPASIAIGHGIDGLTGARLAIGWWGVLGLLSVYFLGARFLGRPAAAAAACLLAINVIGVWFARYPNAELSMQALLFAALLAHARSSIDDDPFFAPVAGWLLGLLLFLRFDAVIAVAAVVAAAWLGTFARQRVRWTFWVTLTVAFVLGAWYYLGPLREYIELPIVYLTNLPGLRVATAAGLALAAIGAIAAARRVSERTAKAIVRAVPTILTVVVVVLALYALMFRHPGGKLTDYDAYALRTFAQFYFTVPALIAALIGYATIFRVRFWRDPAFVITLTAFALLLFYKIHIVPVHFWAARRFVAVILPGSLLAVAAAALTGGRGRLPLMRAIRTPIGIVFVVLLGLDYARAARPVMEHVEYAGVIPRIEALSRLIGDRDLLVVESRDAGSDVHVFATPLAYIYARNVLVLSNAKPDKIAFGAFLDRMHAKYDRVLFLGSGGTDLLSSRWSVTPVASDRFQIPEYDAPWNAYPRFVRQKEFDYSLYAFGPPDAVPVANTLDIGINDDLNVNRFHAKEQTEGRTFRWSQRQSVIIVNRIQATSRTLALWMNNGGRPAAAPPADVTVLIDDRVLATVRVGKGFTEYDIEIPADVARAAASTGEPIRVTLRTPTWNPMKLLGTSDDRDLGVMVDRVAVR
jgi:hypothetical protein